MKIVFKFFFDVEFLVGFEEIICLKLVGREVKIGEMVEIDFFGRFLVYKVVFVDLSLMKVLKNI